MNGRRIVWLALGAALLVGAVVLLLEYLSMTQFWMLGVSIALFAGGAVVLYLGVRRPGPSEAPVAEEAPPPAAAPAPVAPTEPEVAPLPVLIRVAARVTVQVDPMGRRGVRLDVESGDHVEGTVVEANGQKFSWGISNFTSHLAFNAGQSVRMSPGGVGASEYAVDFTAPESSLYLEIWVDEGEAPRTIRVDLTRT